MKVNACYCDFCDKLYPIDEVQGINPFEDLYKDLRASYPIIKSEAANIHFCLECYRQNVINPSSQYRRNEPEYAQRLLEYSYSFKKSTVTKYFKKVAKIR